MLGAEGERDNGAERSDLLKSLARRMQISSLLGIVLIGALCFELGASSRPPTAAGVLVQCARAAERLLLTVSE